jgi:hypothetical protein
MARPSRGLVVAVVAFVAALSVITVLVLRDSPDRSTTTGRVTEVDNRRICVDGAGGDAAQCARVDRPPLVSGVLTGDCVEMRRSGDGILEAVEPAVSC